MKEPQLTQEAKELMHRELCKYDRRRRSKATKLWLGFVTANLSLLAAGAGYVLWWLPSDVKDEAARSAGKDARKAALEYVEKARYRFDKEWKQASDLVANSLKTQVTSVSEEFGKAHKKLGGVEADLEHLRSKMVEITKLATGLEGDAGQELLESIKWLKGNIQADRGIHMLVGIQGRMTSLAASLKTQEDRLGRIFSYKAPASEVRFVRVDPGSPATIQAPGGENISEWNIVVIPIAIGGKPALMPEMAGDLTNYVAGTNEHGLLDQLRCYAQPDDDTHWRIYAKQILSAGLGEAPYGLDVCCLMVRKEVVLGNEN